MLSRLERLAVPQPTTAIRVITMTRHGWRRCTGGSQGSGPAVRAAGKTIGYDGIESPPREEQHTCGICGFVMNEAVECPRCKMQVQRDARAMDARDRRRKKLWDEIEEFFNRR